MNEATQSLEALFHAHRGKVSDKWSSYLPVYSRFFEDYRQSPTKLLEIGIQNGGSLEIYRSYFHPDSTIVGCDINPDCLKLEYGGNIHFVFGDCCAAVTKQEIQEISPRFDIIIDDGSHSSSDIIKALLMYFPLLNEGGVFIIEDLHASYWKGWEGGLTYPFSSIAFLKLLVDTINAEHWGNDRTPEEYLCRKFSSYRDLIQNANLHDVFSVQFFNSICVVEKCKSGGERGLGHRMITGLQALVMPDVLKLNGSGPMTPGQSDNPFAAID